MRALTYILLAAVVLSGCGKSGGGDGGSGDAVPSPDKSTLLFPSQNSVCTTGTTVSASQSAVTFSWSAGNNTDSYELDIKNLTTNTVSTQTVNGNTAQVTLATGTPYAWYIVSKSTKTATTTQSDTWKFYVSGAGITYYAPFPADQLSPGISQTVTPTNNTINLSWKGADADNDIVGYDVYLGTGSTPALLKSNITDMFLNGVTVAPGTSYYWKVVTKDAHGNTTDSGTYPFTVK